MGAGHPEFGPAAAFSLAELLEGRGYLDEAEEVYRWSIRSAHKEFAAWSVSGLAALLEKRGDPDGARHEHMTPLAIQHPEISPCAAVKLLVFHVQPAEI